MTQSPSIETTARPVAAVVLTYNSSADLADCLADLTAQRGIDLRVIVVDNASRAPERALMEDIFTTALTDGRLVEHPVGSAILQADAPALFVRNNENRGYSAGNNIGARIAAAQDCSAVLIINPDVRLADPDYIKTLSDLIHADPHTAVAASAVRNLTGAQENPMVEPGFVEEMLWPVDMIAKGLLRRGTPQRSLPSAPCQVEKVSGACFLIRTDFLLQQDFFDESVFLYCEESILMAQVRRSKYHMVMNPNIEALHAHRSVAKGDPRPRFRNWAKSRTYFHRAYSDYSTLRRGILMASRQASLALVSVRTMLGAVRG